MSALHETLLRRGGYVPGFAPAPGGPGAALIAIAAGQVEAARERVAQGPTKRGLALLDLVGVGLVPAQAARAPVVFEPAPGLDAVTAPAGTRLGAQVPGQEEQVVFETASTVAIHAAQIVEVASVLPGRDAYAMHHADLAAGTPATLFAGSVRFAHDLYLSHDALFAFAGATTVEIDLALRAPAASALPLAASWWDGERWSSFVVDDATRGLTRSGILRLTSPCVQSRRRAVRGQESHWIRVAITEPLPPDVGALPEVARLLVRAVVERRRVVQTVVEDLSLPQSSIGVRVWSPAGAPAPGVALRVRDAVASGTERSAMTNNGGTALFTVPMQRPYRLAVGAAPDPDDWLDAFDLPTTARRADLALQAGLLPDQAIAEGRAVDLTRAFQPLGPAPTVGAAFHVACEDAFSRPGAQVVLVLGRAHTAQDEADELGRDYEINISAAHRHLQGIDDRLRQLASDLEALRATGAELEDAIPKLVKDGRSTDQWYDDLQDVLKASVDLIRGVFQTWLDLGVANLPTTGPEREREMSAVGVRIAKSLERIGGSIGNVPARRAELERRLPDGSAGLLNNLRRALEVELLTVVQRGEFLTGDFPNFLTMPVEDFVTDVSARIHDAADIVDEVVKRLRAVAADVHTFNPAAVAADAGVLPPVLGDAAMAWEYWNGQRWTTLLAAASGATAANLRASGTVRFTVPPDWEPSEVAGASRLWLRARLARGNFAKLRLVSWTDTESNTVNYLPVIEPRPPVLDGVEVFFRHVSPPAPPQRTLAFNDLAWVDASDRTGFPGPGFAPFAPCGDAAPTMYLGFDAPPPAERIGVFLDVEERAGAVPVPLRFEAWDGSGYRPLAVEDGTRGLSESGVVHLLWPGDAAPATTLVLRASGDLVRLAEPGAALRHPPGSLLWLRDERGGEVVEVAAADGEGLRLARPLERAYVGGTLQAAPPARFGTPRAWLRVVFEDDVDPPPVVLRAVVANAVEAVAVETVGREAAGGGDGSPGQVVFLRRTPVVGEPLIEVRELDGPRAAVDGPLVSDELRAQGRDGDATFDSGAVWVRWRVRETLAFSGPADRDVAFDAARGRVLFGDGRFGRVLPPGADNVRVTYRAGGGSGTNVPTGAIANLLSGVLARGVRNVAAAQGGADGETLERVAQRGPAVLRHRRQALTGADYEALALEASATVARARAETVRPGEVRLAIVPHGREPAPQPTVALRRQVRNLIERRAPCTVARPVVVTGPRYADVGLDVAVAARRADDAATVREAVRAAAGDVLHPLRGGHDFGALLAVSDLARALAAIPGVDAVTDLAFVVDGVRQGERLRLEADQLPSAGSVRVSVVSVA